MAITKCKVISFRHAKSLVAANIRPGTGDEQIVVEQELVARGRIKSPLPQNTMKLSDEQYEEGLAITLESVKSKNRVERFFSAQELATMAGISRPLTKDEMEFFGQKLVERKEPICIGIFDKSVELDKVSVKHKPKPKPENDGVLLGSDPD